MTLSAALQSEQELRLQVGGALMAPLPDGALWWEARRLLVVSDLHLEKGSSYAARGQLLPPYDTGKTLSVVERLIAALRPETVVSLGDSFHDADAEARLALRDVERIQALTSSVDWIWVEGNHDPDPPEALGGRSAKVLRLDGVVFRHEPTGEPGEISGHLHPCAKVRSRGRSVRRRCFAADGARLVMPALGAYCGGLNVLDRAFEGVFPEGLMAFALGLGRVYGLPIRSLAPDGGPAASVWRL